MKISTQRIRGTVLAGALVGSLMVTVVPMFSSVVGAVGEGEYIVTFNGSSDLGAKVRKEMQLGNAITDVFTAAAEGFVATLDATDVARLRRDGDLATLELNQEVHLVDVTVAGDVIPGRYIVELEPSASLSASASIASAVGASNVVSYRSAMRGFAADLDTEALALLDANPSVRNIEPDMVVTTLGEQSNPTWGLNRIDQRSLPLDTRYVYANTGTGVTAYVIDTGILPTHNEFGGRVGAGFTTISDGQGSNDCNGHGTHVAGTVGGATYGIAKDVALIPVRVLSCSGSGSTSGVIAGIDWVITHHAAGVPAVANMSLGGGYSELLNSAVARGVADGVVFVVAAGNSNVDACNSSPASEPTAVTVGATSQNDARALFSNFGSCLDIFAPGVGITSSVNTSTSATATWSGTSMASPHVAGIAALMFVATPGITADQVVRGISSNATADVVTNAGSDSPNKLVYSGSLVGAPVVVPSAPSAPWGLASVAGNNSVELSWRAPTSTNGSDIVDYVVEYAVTDAVTDTTTWILFADGTSAATAAIVSGLANDARHYSRVSAVNSVGQSVPSGITSTVPIQAISNDAFAAALQVFGESNNAVSSTLLATREVGEPSHGGQDGSASIWYRWIAPANGTLTLSTEGSTFDTLLGVYFGTEVDALTTLGANDDVQSGVLWSRVVATVVEGREYKIAIDGWRGLKGATKLSWSFVATLPPVAPSSPRNVVASALNASLAVSWLTPTSDGNSPVTLYTATASPGAATCTATGQLGCVIPGLVNGTQYTVSVVATNEVGLSPASDPSSPVAPAIPTTNPVVATSWGLDRIDQRALPLDNTIVRRYTGVGVSAYIIDTGVYATHNEFAGRVATGYSSIGDSNGTNDCQGHGTHVAGTVAGTSFGVAPQATIIPVRVLDCGGSGTTAGVIAGIDWMVAHHAAGVPAVANMSLGGGYSASLNAAVARAVADGIVMAIAAGNENSDACGVSPASEASALTVGATTSSDARASYSNFGSCVDLFAPGSSIVSASNTGSNDSRSLSGTSMAAPHVAGAAALVLEASPLLTPAQVAATMLGVATPNVVTDPVGTSNLFLFVGPTSATAPNDDEPVVDEPVVDEPAVPPVNTVPINTVPINTVPINTVPINTVPINTVPTRTVPTRTVPTRSVATNNGLIGNGLIGKVPQVSVVRSSKNTVTLRIVANGKKFHIYRNGRYLITTTKKLLTVKVQGLTKSRFTVRASRAR